MRSGAANGDAPWPLFVPLNKNTTYKQENNIKPTLQLKYLAPYQLLLLCYLSFHFSESEYIALSKKKGSFLWLTCYKIIIR